MTKETTVRHGSNPHPTVKKGEDPHEFVTVVFTGEGNFADTENGVQFTVAKGNERQVEKAAALRMCRPGLPWKLKGSAKKSAEKPRK